MEIRANTADKLYKECWWRLPNIWVEENSRNGRVYTVPEPVVLQINDPRKRVVFNPVRDANPFFHVAEVVWMFAGEDKVDFIEKFNKRYREYADNGVVNGAYGARWQSYGNLDQIQEAIDILREDARSRQVVISMWYDYDLIHRDYKDRPCNTHIYLRVVDGALDMTVCNRSNDLVWGALGANVVHFTYLQELIAHCAVLKVGKYRVVTNNLHFYPDMPRGQEHELRSKYYDPEPYPSTFPILQADETWEHLHSDCINLHDGVLRHESEVPLVTEWANGVAQPMLWAYLDKENRRDWLQEVDAPDWFMAGNEWILRR